MLNNAKFRVPVIAACVLAGLYLLSEGTRGVVAPFMDFAIVKFLVAAVLLAAAVLVYKVVI